MRLKNPGGELTWLTPLMAVGGIYLGYTSWASGSHVLAAIFASMGLCSLLVWFDQKWVAIPLIFFFTIGLVFGAILLFQQGFTLRKLVRLIVIAYTIYGFWEWQHRPNDDAIEQDSDQVLLKHNPNTLYSSADDADIR